MRMKLVCVALAAMAAALPAIAQEAAKDCAAIDKALPAAMASWTRPAVLNAAAQSPSREGAKLVLGKAVRAAMKPLSEVQFPLAPEEPGATRSHGGLFEFDVTEAGAYSIALGGPAWIDVVKDGKSAESVKHGHAPACSSVRKMVDFKLTPGVWTLQVSKSPDPMLEIMVLKAW